VDTVGSDPIEVSYFPDPHLRGERVELGRSRFANDDQTVEKLIAHLCRLCF
jgi:hypothetical protein